MSDEVTLSDVITEALNKVNRELHVCLPAIIEKYDFKTQKANVKVNIKQVYGESAIDIPIIPNVPVIFSSSGGASITMPVKQGDGCLVLFCDIDIKNWLLGADNVKPQTMRNHHLSDAVAIVGLNIFTKSSQAENNEDVLLSYSDSKIRLKPNGIIDIHNAKEVNVKTESVIINCKNANIKAEESIMAECKNAQVKSAESTSIECKNASIKSSETTSIECKSASVKATESVSVDCKTASIKASDSSTIECQNANVKATGVINTETPNFTQKGNMKIDGNIEITGTSELKGNTTCSATITGNAVKTSSGKDLATHTHGYIDSVGEAATPTQKTTQAPT